MAVCAEPSENSETTLMNTEFITLSEVAVYLRVSDHHVYRLVHERGLPGKRVKGRWVFYQSLVDRWVYTHVRRNLDHRGSFRGTRAAV